MNRNESRIHPGSQTKAAKISAQVASIVKKRNVCALASWPTVGRVDVRTDSMHSNPDNDEVVHGRCVTSIPKERNHLGSPRCLATRGQEDHGGQHGPFPREYRPGLFILTKLAAHLLSHLAFYLLMIGMP